MMWHVFTRCAAKAVFYWNSKAIWFSRSMEHISFGVGFCFSKIQQQKSALAECAPSFCVYVQQRIRSTFLSVKHKVSQEHRPSIYHFTRYCHIHAVIASVFFFVRWFVGRFGCAVGQTHSLPSFGFSVGLCGLAMCVAVQRWVNCFHLFEYRLCQNQFLQVFSFSLYLFHFSLF